MPIESHVLPDSKALSVTQNDTPAHVANAAATNGCFTFLGILEVCWNISMAGIVITIKLKTPFGDVDLGKCELTSTKPSCKLGGSIDGFKAEVDLDVDLAAMSLKICGEVCAPFVGCKKGCTTLHI